MHAPDDYFYHRSAPYLTRAAAFPSDTDFSSVRLGPRVRRTEDGKHSYVGVY